jgi:excisionase family DNA binding protein
MKMLTKASLRTISAPSSLKSQGWMKTEQVADYLGTSSNNIRNMVYRSRLFPKKFGNRLYFRREDIDHLIETERS